MHFKETEYGFEWGAAKVTRLADGKEKGSVILGISAGRANQNIQVYVTKSGKIRVFRAYSNEEMMLPR